MTNHDLIVARDEPLTPERYRQIRALADAALERPTSERSDFIEQSCGTDASLRAEVLALVQAHQAIGSDIGTPARLGPYLLLRELGRGGMGAVYLAVRDDGTYDRQVAIKMMRPDVAAEALLARFRHEQQILGSLDHPNIARLMDAGVSSDDRPYIVMEYVDGVPITQYCDRARLNIRQRLELFRAVCTAVEHAHRKLIVHRDLKPSNILVGADGVPKLLDFGIAKVLSPAGGNALDLTQGLTPGTPAYASPEQLRGDPIQPSTDVYALGVILHQLLVGCFPVRSESPSARWRAPSDAIGSATAAFAAAKNTSSAKLRRALRGDLDSIVLMSLQPDARVRYQSVGDLNADLGRHLDRWPVFAQPSTPGYVMARFAARNARGLAVSALLLATVLVGLAGTWVEWRRADGLRQLAERRFEDVRGLADTVFELQQALAGVPNATPVRDSLVRSSLQYLSSLERDARGEPTLLRQVAVGYRSVGRALGDPRAASARDQQTALRSYQGAVRVSEQLARQSQADPQTLADMSMTLVAIGDILDARDEPAAAREHYARAQQIAVELAGKYPKDSRLHEQLATIVDRLHGDTGRGSWPGDGERLYYEAVRESYDADRLEFFLARFPSGAYSQEVRKRLDLLRAGKLGKSDGPRSARSGRLDSGRAEADTSSTVAPPEAGSFEWKRIPAGRFQMGCVENDAGCGDDERPRHWVTLPQPFEVTATLVTVDQYRQVGAVAGSRLPVQPEWSESSDLPVVNVTWDEAERFCAALGGRLPTEAEWEFAARGGGDNRIYPWGDRFDRTSGNAGFPGRDGWDKASPVKAFRANGYGLFDVVGNVWEWVRDWYDAAYYQHSPEADPKGPPTGTRRVLRGGSYDRSPSFLRASQRATDTFDRGHLATGFRCVRSSQ